VITVILNDLLLQEGDTVVGCEDASKLPDIGIRTYLAVGHFFTCFASHQFCVV